MVRRIRTVGWFVENHENSDHYSDFYIFNSEYLTDLFAQSIQQNILDSISESGQNRLQVQSQPHHHLLQTRQHRPHQNRDQLYIISRFHKTFGEVYPDDKTVNSRG
jgi:hypothetical protein